jgi:hypothetical protein
MIAGMDIRTPLVKKAGLTILKTLAYFDIFDYPLSENEIQNLLQELVDASIFAEAIKLLLHDKIIFSLNGFYALENDVAKVERRLEGNMRARNLLPTARKIGSFLFKFPYVRGVAISGSLSKNYADKKGDIDFFIITKANRLWIARTVLHLFKKSTFLIGRQHYYCMNYFIDEEALRIPERNIYTATEVITLLPVAGSAAMDEFFEVNAWSKEMFPAYAADSGPKTSNNITGLKAFGERIFNGDNFDNFLFRWTSRRWKKKEMRRQKNSKGKVMNLLTGKHFSKSDPEAFQQKILSLYQGRIKRLADQWGIFD